MKDGETHHGRLFVLFHHTWALLSFIKKVINIIIFATLTTIFDNA